MAFLALEKVLCHTQELPGAWVKGQSAGGCRNNSGFPSNPKFWLRVSELSEVYVAVLQRPRMRMADWAARARALAGADRAACSPESFPGKDYQAVGLHIWKVTLCGPGCLLMGCVDGDVEAHGGLSPRSCHARTHVTTKSPTCPTSPGPSRGVRCLLLLPQTSAKLSPQDSAPSRPAWSVSDGQRERKQKQPPAELAGGTSACGLLAAALFCEQAS